jgi:hypothetical protein
MEHRFSLFLHIGLGAHSSVVDWGTMLQAGRSPVWVPNEVDFFNLHNPSGRTMTLGSTQSLTEMSIRNLKCGRCIGLTILPPSVWKCGSLNLSQPYRPPRLCRDNFTFTCYFTSYRFSFSYGSAAQFLALATSMKLLVSFRLLHLGQSAGLLGRVISSSQGLCMSAPDDWEDGEVGGMNGFGRENQSTQRKPALMPLCPPQIPLSRPGHKLRPPRWEASN